MRPRKRRPVAGFVFPARYKLTEFTMWEGSIGIAIVGALAIWGIMAYIDKALSRHESRVSERIKKSEDHLDERLNRLYELLKKESSE